MAPAFQRGPDRSPDVRPLWKVYGSATASNVAFTPAGLRACEGNETARDARRLVAVSAALQEAGQWLCELLGSRSAQARQVAAAALADLCAAAPPVRPKLLKVGHDTRSLP